MKSILAIIESGLVKIVQRIATSAAVSARAMSLFRIIGGLLILHFILPYGGYLQLLPGELYNPGVLQLGSLFARPPGAVYFMLLESLAVLSCVAMTVGFYGNWAARLLSLCYLGITIFTYGYGKVDHFFLLPLSLFLASFSKLDGHYTLRTSSRKNTDWPITLLAVCLAFGMLTAGLPKLLIWVDFDPATSGFMNWFNGALLGHGETFTLASHLMTITPAQAEILDYLAVIFELSALLCLLLGRKWWRSWLAVACLFHLFNHLALGIDFRQHWIVYLPFALDGIIGVKLDHYLNSNVLKSRLLGYTLIIAGYQLFQRWQLSGWELGENPYWLMQRDDFLLLGLVWISLSVVLLVNKVARF